jgi:flagellar biosynthetic protein FlhB
MSGGDDQSDDEKEHAPSQKRMEDARKKGDVAKSTELSAAAGYGGLLLAGMAGLGAVGAAGQGLALILDRAPEIAALAARSARPVVAGMLGSVAMPLILFLGLPALVTLIALTAQRAIVFAPDKLMPKLSRISPIATAKQKFGPDGLFEFAKSFIKLMLVAIVLSYFLIAHSETILASASLEPRLGLIILFGLLGQFLLIVLVLTAVIGCLDYLWQHHARIKRNRMSRKEMTDEMKESDGDPHSKAQRRQRGQELAMNQMLADVAQANVVIVNPTHYAVALKWQRGARSAPILVAKGVDEVARRIREKAAEKGVPLHSDPPTARAIHATVEVGKPIQRDHYRAVAAAIRFAEGMRKRAKGLTR